MRIHKRKCYRFSFIRSHIEAIVPVGVLKPHNIMASDIEKLAHILHKQMFEDRARQRPAGSISLYKILLVEIRID